MEPFTISVMVLLAGGMISMLRANADNDLKDRSAELQTQLAELRQSLGQLDSAQLEAAKKLRDANEDQLSADQRKLLSKYNRLRIEMLQVQDDLGCMLGQG